MKPTALAVLLVALGCSSANRQPGPGGDASPGYVVLATFTGEVDPVAGTFVIQSTPTAAGRALGGTGLMALDNDVTVANKVVGGNPVTFFNSDQGVGRACTGGQTGKVWGATVNITNNLPDTVLGGVYAEITSGTPVTALESCSSASAPPGLQALPGLWSYPQIAAGATQEVDWVFTYVTASRFTFSGRIVGAKVTMGDWAGPPVTQRPIMHDGWYGGPVIVDAGTYLAVANASTGPSFGIDFVLPATGAFAGAVDTPAQVTSLAVATSRIWFVTNAVDYTLSYVGHVNKDGTGSAVYDPTGLPNPSQLIAILPDPVSPNTKAWLVWNNRGNTTYVKSYTPGAGSGLGTFGAQVSTAGMSYSATMGADQKIYAAGFSGGNIPVFSPTEPPTVTTIFPSDPGCFAPGFIIQGLDGKLYFSNWGAARSICRVDDVALGTTSVVGVANASPQGLAVSAAGAVWVGTNGTPTVEAIDTSGGTNNITLVDAVSPVYPLCLASDGALWFGDHAGLWKISQ